MQVKQAEVCFYLREFCPTTFITVRLNKLTYVWQVLEKLAVVLLNFLFKVSSFFVIFEAFRLILWPFSEVPVNHNSYSICRGCRNAKWAVLVMVSILKTLVTEKSNPSFPHRAGLCRSSRSGLLVSLCRLCVWFSSENLLVTTTPLFTSGGSVAWRHPQHGQLVHVWDLHRDEKPALSGQSVWDSGHAEGTEVRQRSQLHRDPREPDRNIHVTHSYSFSPSLPESCFWGSRAKS